MRKYIPVLISCLILFTEEELRAGTPVTGDIERNTTWTKANSPYIITKSIDILKGDTLTIESGVVVEFNDSAFLGQHGALIANGTPSDSIIFTSSSDSPHMSIYDGILVESPSNSFSYCHFLYAAFALQMSPTDPYIFPISHCTFTLCYQGLTGYGAAPQTISDCFFERNSVGAAQSGYSLVTFSNCLFKYNSFGVTQAVEPIIILQNGFVA